MTASKSKIQDGRIIGFDVTVETTIGTVAFDSNGDRSPFAAAMEVIADYVAGTPESVSDGAHTFRFPGWHEDQTIRVTIESEPTGDTYREPATLKGVR